MTQNYVNKTMFQVWIFNASRPLLGVAPLPPKYNYVVTFELQESLTTGVKRPLKILAKTSEAINLKNSKSSKARSI